MFKAVVGHSNDPDSQSAIDEVLQQCQNSLDGKLPQAGILLAAIDFDHPLILAQIQEAFPGIELIGTTTNGEVSSIMGFQEDSLSLMIFCSDQVEIRAGLGRGVTKDLNLAVNESIATATAKLSSPAKLCLTLPESINVDGVSLIAALRQGLGETMPIVGGTSADNLTFRNTKQFFQSEVASGAVPILLFAGNLQYAHGIASGWQSVGRTSVITKAEDCIIYEIDGKKALDFYQDGIGTSNTMGYINYPLAISESGSEDYCLRSPASHDDETGSMTFTSSIPEGATVWMAEASRENVLNATALSLENALSNYPNQSPAAAFIISCAARRLLLGTQTQEEYEIFKTKLQIGRASCRERVLMPV